MEFLETYRDSRVQHDIKMDAKFNSIFQHIQEKESLTMQDLDAITDALVMLGADATKTKVERVVYKSDSMKKRHQELSAILSHDIAQNMKIPKSDQKNHVRATCLLIIVGP